MWCDVEATKKETSRPRAVSETLILLEAGQLRDTRLENARYDAD